MVAFCGLLAACADPAPRVSGIAAFAAGGGDPAVTATDPDTATQGTTLDVVVSGSNFDAGSVAQWAINGVPSVKVRTNSTRFVNSRRVVANITIASDADPTLYDVLVTTGGGKKGIGTELFTVKGSNGPVTYPARVSILDAPTNALVSDGKASVPTEPAGSYDDNVCGVQALINGPNSGGDSYLQFRPYNRLASSLKGPAGRRCQQRDSLRSAFVRLSDTTRARLAGAPTGETTLGALGYVAGERRDTLGLTRVHYLLSVPVGATQPRHGGLNLAFCLAPDGTGSPFRFASDLGPGSDSLLITRTSPTHWVVETQPYPNNKGWCEHHTSDGSIVTLLIHVDFRLEIDNLSP
jgi:hypothetical protein